jgi:hypothetical protein
MRWAILVLPALWTASTWAQHALPESHVSQEQFTCHLSGTPDVRQIGIYRPGAPRRCRVDYTRGGKTRSLWSSGHDYQFCVAKALEIVGLLERVNFKCALHTDPTESKPIR